MYILRGDRHFDDVAIYPRSGFQLCELDKIVANASKFYLFAENRHEIYTGPKFCPFRHMLQCDSCPMLMG